ncbi:hypothetical protein NQ176_g5306 [Zarea fungicola]|uniref:Uncharacterized protein n=1 Tax=Zarea fungicola TaxID=93591 RepID=A0ACC1NB21_9HYPO|nr:hypothetical protein NQ176_g5306 [Lecanicillium fungicola]
MLYQNKAGGLTARSLEVLAASAWAIVATGAARAALVNVAADPVAQDLRAVAAVLALVSTGAVAISGDAGSSLQLLFWLRESQNLAAKREKRKGSKALGQIHYE